MKATGKCPVCDNPLTLQQPGGDPRQAMVDRVSCEVCGDYSIHTGPYALELKKRNPKARVRYALSHYIRQQSLYRKWPTLTEERIRATEENPELPAPPEQIPLLVKYLGKELSSPGSVIELDLRRWAAVVGAESEAGAQFTVAYAVDSGLVATNGVNGSPGLQLTMDGWKEFERLLKPKRTGMAAFMAMSFHNPSVDAAYRECFRGAVAQTGFVLTRVDEAPKAGLIDDLIRVSILSARFVVADLTDSNAGAYWEAGYAEGLGKPVIYTCDEQFRKENNGGTHFDTRNRQTVFWESGRLEDAGKRLVACIRATFPDEARMEDADIRP